MTIDISDNNPRVEYAVAAGVTQTTFAVPFDFFEDSDVSVYVDGVLKTLGSNYTLTGGNGSTGSITSLSVTGIVGGSTVSVTRHTSLERTTDFPTGQEINRASLNEQLDTIVAQVADLDAKVDRTVHLNDYEVAPSMLLTGDRKGKTLAFNVTTGAVEVGPTSADTQTVADNIAVILAAPAEAAAAATSATAAAASAVDATNNGAAQVNLAANQVTLAETAKTAAELAETNAGTAESSASTSASSATSSASTASTGASTATTKASEAATSATNAATSATESETAKDAAETARDAALAALDNFDDRYLGAKANAPTVDNDGNALIVGALYFNTGTDKLYIWNGTAWQVTTSGAAAGDLISTNNLSDVTSAPASRTNLGLGTTDSPTFDGLTTTADVSFGDSDKAIFGAGSDLQIYHDGSNSYIKEAGQGALVLQGTHMYLKSTADEYYLKNTADGSVEVYHNGSSKLATTSTGIDVTGTVTADGLTVEGASSGVGLIKIIDSDGPNESRLTQSGSHLYVDNTSTGSLRFRTDTNKERLSISSGGDVSFFPVAGGGTAGFFWDSSTERLGIGTSSPATALDVAGDLTLDASNAEINLKAGVAGTSGAVNWTFNTAGTNYASISLPYDTRASTGLHIDSGYPITVDATTRIDFDISGTTKASLDSTGLDVTGDVTVSGTDPTIYINETDTSANHRILSSAGALYIQAEDSDGTSDGDLHLTGMNNNDLRLLNIKAVDTDINGNLSVTNRVTATTVDLGDWTVTESSGVLHFATGGVNKMKLDATGNLTVVGNVTAYGTI